MEEEKRALGKLIAEGSVRLKNVRREKNEFYSGIAKDYVLTESGFDKYGTIQNAVRIAKANHATPSGL